MLCKKCGADIADTSKFCGYCGNPVEVLNESINNIETNEIHTVEVKNEPINVTQPIENLGGEESVVANATNEIDLGQTIKIEPVQSEVQSVPEQPVEQVVAESPVVEPIINEPVVNGPVSEPIIDNQVNEPMQQQQFMNTMPNQQVPVSEPVIQSASTMNQKNNKLIFIIGGIALAIVAIVVVLFAFMKSTNNSVAVLKKAIANLEEKGENSATIDAKLSMVSATGESFSFSATVKAEEKNDDKMDMQVTVNKSLFFEEMNIYASLDEKNVTMYMESSLIDMMGTTSSLTPTWVYYTMALNEIMDEEAADESIDEIDLEDIIDEKHFVYVDDKNELKHYQLIIDQQLIDTIKLKLTNVNDKDVKDIIDSMGTLEQTIKIDFYITKSNELSKIELDMTEYLEDAQDISSFVIGIEFRDLNNTKVEIPSDAKKTTTDLESYMTLNAISDYGFDTDSTYDGMNSDYNYDTTLDNTVYGF